MPLNLQKLRVEFEKQVFNTNQFKGLAQGIAQRRANIAQQDMVEAFEEHEVTKELEAGNTGSSSVINYFSENGEGNLFSFIGFPEGTDPVAVLRELLKFPIQVKLSTRVDNTYYFQILAPSSEDIQKVTPLPSDYFEGDFSWAQGVEDGDIPGIGQFLNIKASASRSGGGIQIHIKDGGETGSTLRPTPYISEILEAFRSRLQELSS